VPKNFSSSQIKQSNHSVIAIAVVTATQGDLRKSHGGIELPGSLIGAGHFQAGPLSPGLTGKVEEGLQHLTAQSQTAVGGMDRQSRDLKFLRHQPGAHQSQKAPILVAPAQHGPGGLQEFSLPLLFRPQPPEGQTIQSQASLHSLRPQRLHRNGLRIGEGREGEGQDWELANRPGKLPAGQELFTI
jgi:hypothetical protein